VKRLCSFYGVARAGYYAWRQREESARHKQDRVLTRAIQEIFRGSHGTYGSPRVQRELASRGVGVSRRRVERLMRAAGMRARSVVIYRAQRAMKLHYSQHPNRLWKAAARRPDRIWVGDVTYVRVGQRWRFLAMVMDQYSRRVLGWSLARTRTTALTRAAFDHAIRHRRPGPGLIFHSDRGNEYVGADFHERLESLGVRQSTTRGGTPAENAHAESFFHSLKADILHGLTFANDGELRRCLRMYLQYYNYKRLHSSLDYRSPVAFEQRAA
jgi:transposase InsO family protein